MRTFSPCPHIPTAQFCHLQPHLQVKCPLMPTESPGWELLLWLALLSCHCCKTQSLEQGHTSERGRLLPQPGFSNTSQVSSSVSLWMSQNLWLEDLAFRNHRKIEERFQESGHLIWSLSWEQRTQKWELVSNVQTPSLKIAHPIPSVTSPSTYCHSNGCIETFSEPLPPSTVLLLPCSQGRFPPIHLSKFHLTSTPQPRALAALEKDKSQETMKSSA